jgi:hypothetical protein
LYRRAVRTGRLEAKIAQSNELFSRCADTEILYLLAYQLISPEGRFFFRISGKICAIGKISF